MKNINDVVAQLNGLGLVITSVEADGQIHRCKTIHDKEKSGWYVLFEMRRDNGESLITGSFGYWTGTENNKQNIDLTGLDVSKDEQKLISRRLSDSKKQLDNAEKARREKAAAECEIAWNAATPNGSCDYLTKKSINAYGVRFNDKNALLIPICDIVGRIHSLQTIHDSQSESVKRTGRNKDFHSGGAKKGYFHFIGGLPKTVLLVAEGYATAATLHEATGLPVVVCFDAGNLSPVVEALRKQYWKIKILICADDDTLYHCATCQGVIDLADHKTDCPHCAKAHKRTNAGVKAANAAAYISNASVIIPDFLDKNARLSAYAKNTKYTDFNDLAALYGLHTVRAQLEAYLDKKKWSLETAAKPHDRTDMLVPINTVDELLNNFSLIHGMDKSVFDHRENMMVSLVGLREIVQGRDTYKHWQEHAQKKILRIKNFGFDPTGKDKNIIANLFDGFDTVAKEGNCDNITDLLQHLCGGMTEDGRENYRWIVKWLAYPLQNQGAKMKTSVVIHGGQGVGKNLFFELIKDIYGQYGGIIGQTELESQYNQWASRKLFLVADEIATQQEKYQVKNKLKSMITGDWINIRPLYMNAYSERNHLNMVFLSNDRVPVILEPDDRRHTVLWVKEKPDDELLVAALAEIKNGGLEALYYYLLYEVDCTDFNEHTKPLLNKDKLKLMDLCLDNIILFFRDWSGSEIKDLSFLPAPSELIYQLYKTWCTKQGVRSAANNKFIDRLEHSCDFQKLRTIVKYAGVHSKNPVRCLTHPKNATSYPDGFQTMSALDLTQAEWLGGCAEKMQQAINALADHSGGFID
jgi:putative DNA primase/helicase